MVSRLLEVVRLRQDLRLGSQEHARPGKPGAYPRLRSYLALPGAQPRGDERSWLVTLPPSTRIEREGNCR